MFFFILLIIIDIENLLMKQTINVNETLVLSFLKLGDEKDIFECIKEYREEFSLKMNKNFGFNFQEIPKKEIKYKISIQIN